MLKTLSNHIPYQGSLSLNLSYVHKDKNALI